LYCKLIENKLFSFFEIYEFCSKTSCTIFRFRWHTWHWSDREAFAIGYFINIWFFGQFFWENTTFFQNLNCNYQTERVCQEAREETFGNNGLQTGTPSEFVGGADVDEEISQKIRHCCNKVEIQFTIWFFGELRHIKLLQDSNLEKKEWFLERQKTSAGWENCIFIWNFHFNKINVFQSFETSRPKQQQWRGHQLHHGKWTAQQIFSFVQMMTLNIRYLMLFFMWKTQKRLKYTNYRYKMRMMMTKPTRAVVTWDLATRTTSAAGKKTKPLALLLEKHALRTRVKPKHVSHL